MKKTLIELLSEKKYQTCNVKIGSKSGTGFWYCGKGNLFYSKKEIEKAIPNLLKQTKGTLYQLEYRLKHLDKIYDDLNKSAKRVKNLEDYKKNNEIKKQREKVMLPKKIESVKYDLETPLFDREIKEIVYGISPDEKPCWIIYVKGNEKGAYWTIEEYNKRRKRNDN